MRKNLLFIAIGLIFFTSCQQRLSITKKYHSFGWNIALESNQKNIPETQIKKNSKKNPKNKLFEKDKQENLKENQVFSAIINDNNNTDLKTQEFVSQSVEKYNSLKGKNIQKKNIQKKKQTLVENKILNKIKYKEVKKTNQSGALSTIGWIFIILGIIFILIISIGLGVLFCLLGLLFILVGK